jgi:hypothetical protein
MSHTRKLILRLVILAIILGGASFVAWWLGYFHLLANGGLRRLLDRLHRVPWIGPWYVLGYAVIAALGIPLTPLILLAGALFGFAEGAVVAWVGLLLGTSGAYWIARLIGGSSVTRLLAGREDIVAGRLRGRQRPHALPGVRGGDGARCTSQYSHLHVAGVAGGDGADERRRTPGAPLVDWRGTVRRHDELRTGAAAPPERHERGWVTTCASARYAIPRRFGRLGVATVRSM